MKNDEVNMNRKITLKVKFFIGPYTYINNFLINIKCKNKPKIPNPNVLLL